MSANASELAERVRDDFPTLSRSLDGVPLRYFDSAASSLRPRAVVDAIAGYYLRNGANIHRGKHVLSEEASSEYERARHKVASFVGYAGNEVVFVRNTTEALGLVAQGLGLATDDTVLVGTDAHHSLLLPWRAGARVQLVRTLSDGTPDLDDYRDKLRLRPKVVALTHCSNVTGRYAPLVEMIHQAHAVGALAVVDAAQSVPHRWSEIRGLGADLVAFSGHKMLGPSGIGALCGRFEVLDRLRPLLVGGGTVDWVDFESHRPRRIPHRLEAGTPNIAGAYGLAAAIDYLEAVGANVIAEHDALLAQSLCREAAARDYLDVLGGTSATDRAGLLTFQVRRCKDLGDIARALSDSYGFMCRTGHLCAQPLVDAWAEGDVLRVSAYIYNTPAEIGALFKALDELHPLFAL